MGKKGTPGISKLAATLSKRMQLENELPETIDFGVINADLSLQTDTFPIPIPEQDYFLLLPISGVGETEEKRKLQEGDRVLVIWSQKEVVVVGLLSHI